MFYYNVLELCIWYGVHHVLIYHILLYQLLQITAFSIRDLSKQSYNRELVRMEQSQVKRTERIIINS